MLQAIKYYVKAYSYLARNILQGRYMPYHSSNRGMEPRKEYRHNGIWNTVKGIARGECRVHWLRDADCR